MPWEERLPVSRTIKTNKYAPLVRDILSQGHKVNFIPLEIGVRGIVNNENENSIRRIQKLCKNTVTFKFLREIISKTAVSASYYIFLSRDQSGWGL